VEILSVFVVFVGFTYLLPATLIGYANLIRIIDVEQGSICGQKNYLKDRRSS